MQDDLRLAVPAEHREAVGVGIGVHMQEPTVAPADGACHPSVHYDQFTTGCIFLQGFFPPFLLFCQPNNYTSSTISI